MHEVKTPILLMNKRTSKERMKTGGRRKKRKTKSNNPSNQQSTDPNLPSAHLNVNKQNTEKRQRLKIISTNLNGGINDKINDIERMAHEEDADFILIQEAKQIKEKLFTNYKTMQKYVVYDSLYETNNLKRMYRTKKRRKINRDFKNNKYQNKQEYENDLVNINPNKYTAHGGMITLMHKRWCGKVNVTLDEVAKRFIITTLKIKEQGNNYCKYICPLWNNKRGQRENPLLL